jgi:tetratricopeptide (TPR) repeat protein
MNLVQPCGRAYKVGVFERYPRLPAAVILLLALGLGLWLVLDQHLQAGTADEASLTKLQQAIGQDGAKPEAWFQYAQALQNLGRLRYASMAYRRGLDAEPFNRQARLQCALCLAGDGNRNEELYDFIKEMVLNNPQLAVDVLSRPVCQTYMNDPRFQTLAKEAQVLAMD